jgi:NADPH-dependent glutamate synthase beta subunit-like oxidoreductase
MRFGIPAYRLPRDELAREIERLEAMGVRIVCNHRVENVLAEKAEGFDAVFLAIGAGVSKHIDVPARDAARVIDAVSLLHDVTCGEPPRLGRRVVVYGGGDTAMDAARTAKRLGAEDALIIYRRDRSHMPAHAFEVAEAIEEGVRVKWLTTIKDFSGPELTVEVMEVDADGRPRPTGQLETLQADALVLAVGQETQSGFLTGVPGIQVGTDGAVRVGPDMMTGIAGVFAGGDMIAGERSVTVAVGHGKRAARHIDAWLRGESLDMTSARTLASFDKLRLPVYADVRAIAQQVLPPAQRVHGFAEVVAGLSQADARYEAGRCLSCGNCFECDGCYAACPQQAIVKLGVGHGYRIEYERCTGCGACFEQCPVHAMDMVAESAP